MKKFAIAVVIVLIGAVGWGEELYSPLKVGISASVPEIPTGANIDHSGVPGLSLGFTMHLVPQFAIRPSAVFFQNTYLGDGLAIGGGMDLLYFFPFPGNVSLFLGAGYSYTAMTVITGMGANDESDSQYHRIALIVGGQYLFSRNFGVSVEMGLAAFFKFLRQRSWDVNGVLLSDTSTNGSYQLLHAPTLGVVIYFN
jgi:hypothetical protein